MGFSKPVLCEDPFFGPASKGTLHCSINVSPLNFFLQVLIARSFSWIPASKPYTALSDLIACLEHLPRTSGAKSFIWLFLLGSCSLTLGSLLPDSMFCLSFALLPIVRHSWYRCSIYLALQLAGDYPGQLSWYWPSPITNRYLLIDFKLKWLRIMMVLWTVKSGETRWGYVLELVQLLKAKQGNEEWSFKCEAFYWSCENKWIQETVVQTKYSVVPQTTCKSWPVEIHLGLMIRFAPQLVCISTDYWVPILMGWASVLAGLCPCHSD